MTKSRLCQRTSSMAEPESKAVTSVALPANDASICLANNFISLNIFCLLYWFFVSLRRHGGASDFLPIPQRRKDTIVCPHNCELSARRYSVCLRQTSVKKAKKAR